MAINCAVKFTYYLWATHSASLVMLGGGVTCLVKRDNK
jgi:hypothetical protein